MNPNPQLEQITHELDKTLTLYADNEPQKVPDNDNNDNNNEEEDDNNEVDVDDDDDDDDDDGDDDEGNFEFFVGAGEFSSPVSAEDIFHNGQIRPIYAGKPEEATTSYSSPVRKVFFVSDEEGVVEGPYCDFSTEKSSEKNPAPEMSRKSNSTGFSRLWRFRDLLVRSHSDGKDAFVFLTGKNNSNEEKTVETTTGKNNSNEEKTVETVSFQREDKDKKTKNKKKKVVSESKPNPKPEEKGKGGRGKKSAYEVLYGGKKKEGKLSYLPYRQDLVGFFTNASGMSKNLHPY